MLLETTEETSEIVAAIHHDEAKFAHSIGEEEEVLELVVSADEVLTTPERFPV
jgi:hypothetical protein